MKWQLRSYQISVQKHIRDWFQSCSSIREIKNSDVTYCNNQLFKTVQKTANYNQRIAKKENKESTKSTCNQSFLLISAQISNNSFLFEVPQMYPFSRKNPHIFIPNPFPHTLQITPTLIEVNLY